MLETGGQLKIFPVGRLLLAALLTSAIVWILGCGGIENEPPTAPAGSVSSGAVEEPAVL